MRLEFDRADDVGFLLDTVGVTPVPEASTVAIFPLAAAICAVGRGWKKTRLAHEDLR
jgi:hypothetical protein